MIERLIKDYDEFHDALILNFEYKTNIDLGDEKFKQDVEEIILVISCFNFEKDFIRETVSIVFKDVVDFRYKKFEGMVINLLVEKENDNFIFDFDPTILSVEIDGKFILERNLNSYLSIKFKNLAYEII